MLDPRRCSANPSIKRGIRSTHYEKRNADNKLRDYEGVGATIAGAASGGSLNMRTRHTDVIETEWDDRAVEQAVDEAIAAGRTRVRPSRMKLGDYNGFPGDLRALADRTVR
jgi:hypothetical protein